MAHPVLDLGDGLGIDPIASGQSPQALLTILYCSTDSLRRFGAPLKKEESASGTVPGPANNNGHTILRDKIEARILTGLTEKVVSADAVAEAVRAYAEALNQQNRECRAQMELDNKTLEKVECGIAGMMILTTAFDVSTASFVDSFSVAAQEAFPSGLAFSTGGTTMFVVGSSGDSVYEYTLTTGFDVSTASFVDSFSVATQDTNPRGLAFSTDGTTMFVVGLVGDRVYEYQLGTPFSAEDRGPNQNSGIGSGGVTPATISLRAKALAIGASAWATRNLHRRSRRLNVHRS